MQRTVTPTPTPACPPWCNTAPHDADDIPVHHGRVETAGPVEFYLEDCAGQTTTVIQLGGSASERLDIDEIDAIIAKLAEHRAELAATQNAGAEQCQP